MRAPAMEREDILRLTDLMIERQRRKLLDIARETVPGATEEDIRNPQDFPALTGNARFHFEDGILAGYLGMRMALIHELNRRDEKTE